MRKIKKYIFITNKRYINKITGIGRNYGK